MAWEVHSKMIGLKSALLKPTCIRRTDAAVFFSLPDAHIGCRYPVRRRNLAAEWECS